MKYVNLGATGTKVSRICLGMMTYGSSKWREWVLDEEASKPLSRRIQGVTWSSQPPPRRSSY